jgi:hypothetical protein
MFATVGWFSIAWVTPAGWCPVENLRLDKAGDVFANLQ